MQYPLRDAAYRNRLASYGPNFPHCGVGKEELAEAGFRYEGCEDQVRCDYCRGGFKSWREGDSPLNEHKQYFPYCSFLRPLLSFPKHQEYTNIRERIESFPTEQRNDPSTNPSVNDFSECGFFSHSAISSSTNETSDTVACYYCGITLARWNPGDDVWREHARASPDCGFLVLIKGADFVQLMHARNRPTIAPSPLIVQQHTSSLRAVTEIESRSIGTSPITTDVQLHRRTALRSSQFMPVQQLTIASPDFHSRSSIMTHHDSVSSLAQYPLEYGQPAASLRAPISSSSPSPSPSPLQQQLESQSQMVDGNNSVNSGSTQLQQPRHSPLHMASLSHALNQTAALISPRVNHSPVGHHQHHHQHGVRLSPAVSSSISPSSSSSPNSRGTDLNLARITRYSNNSRRSPIHLSRNRISPYTIPRNSINSRTPEPLPETNDVSEEQVRRMYENLLRQRECKVCLSNLATVCFLPCRHLSACPACAPQLQNCHLCRTRIDKRFDVYLS